MKVRLDFCDMGPGFIKTNNFFIRLLQRRFDVELADCPDFLLYFDPNQHLHRLHNCVRIHVGTEWYLPDWLECDYALTPNYLDDPRHLRLPFYVAWRDGFKPLIRQNEDPERMLAEKTGFCSFVVSTNHPKKNRKRMEFFQKLSRYKKVDSGGKFLNNIGGPIPWGWNPKVEFLRRYKFNLAFENESHEGYTTEKLYDAMLARTVPIYWGNPRVGEEFNPKSFLSYYDHGSDEALIEKIIALDRDDAQYLGYARQPYFHGNQPNEFFNPERLLDFFERVFTTPIEPVSRRRRFFELNRWLVARKNRPRPMPTQG
ncbi:MAG TPA: glycosyltransferase family 10 [Candidatus Acidoferrum sp.]|nr:glycosyltransferase family 10 [Candidatus Acidoferrum sp.]